MNDIRISEQHLLLEISTARMTEPGRNIKGLESLVDFKDILNLSPCKADYNQTEFQLVAIFSMTADPELMEVMSDLIPALGEPDHDNDMLHSTCPCREHNPNTYEICDLQDLCKKD